MSPRALSSASRRARRERGPRVVAVSGASGAGKTRLLSLLIPALGRRGVTVAVVKHTRHRHAFDRPGKDTDVLRRAGAVAAAIEGPDEMALFGPPAGSLRALVRLLPPVDLVLAEGWKSEPVPRIEVHRRAIAAEFLCARDRRVFAVVTDEPPPRPVRVFSDGDVEALADLVRDRCGLGGKPRGRRRLRVGPTVLSLRREGSGRTAPRRTERMAKTTKRKSSSRRGGRRSGASRQGAGRKGGNATLRSRGPEFYSEIGRKGGRSRARSAARASSGRSSGRRSGSSSRGSSRGGTRRGGSRAGSRSRRGTRSR